MKRGSSSAGKAGSASIPTVISETQVPNTKKWLGIVWKTTT
ncbi:MAG TPA: hypothetical protein VKA10_00240 [Prolixibacteraceae bacterium]|nr:hypothetical protein [Prolixibacteraceae bacterium]